MRFSAQLNLENYVNDRQYEGRGRFGEMLLLLPTLQSLAGHLIEHLQLAVLVGAAPIDSILQDMILGGSTSDSVRGRGTAAHQLAGRRGGLVISVTS